MKKVIIFGATGSVGRHIVEQSLEEGNSTVAFCRDREKLNEFSNPNLIIVEGDVRNQQDVDAAVKDVDVVIITLGSGKKRKSDIRSVGTQNIISAMKKSRVSRLICQSTLGTGDSAHTLNFFWKHIMFGWFLKNVFQDHIIQEEYVTNSGLDWTIVKPAAFTNGERTGNYEYGFFPANKKLTLKISRKDVADFVLKQVNSTEFLKLTPGLSY